ncbi:LLM class flavin-dependent oxidoreductase [Microtetraspora glauca]|uniref:LLM class flavin-dependent oxidoreductase n=1 Tax=Microtetraspora glauca TaxID=1996 RepID=A0ABV3GPL6_MICGL
MAHLGVSSASPTVEISARPHIGRNTYNGPLWAVFGYLAVPTRQIRLGTQVLVLVFHHPLAIAKRYGTLEAGLRPVLSGRVQVNGGRLCSGGGLDRQRVRLHRRTRAAGQHR